MEKKELHELMHDIKPSSNETTVKLGEITIVMNVVERLKSQDATVFKNLMNMIEDIK